MEITGNRRLSPLADLGKARSCASPFFFLALVLFLPLTSGRWPFGEGVSLGCRCVDRHKELWGIVIGGSYY